MRAVNSRLGAGSAGVLFLLSIACGIAGPVQGVFISRGTLAAGSDVEPGSDSVDISDSGLAGTVTVLRVGSEVGQNNLLSVFAGLRNKTERRLNLEIETLYQDRDGNALNSGSWIPFTLKAGEEKEYRSVSISEQAVDFVIRVRHARN